MTKYILLTIIFSILGCNKGKSEIFERYGLPSGLSIGGIIYFNSTNHGYYFGNLMQLNEDGNSDVNSPDLPPKLKYKAVIYKTIDGGKNWEHIISLNNYSFTDHYVKDNLIFLVISEEINSGRKKVVKFDINNDSLSQCDLLFEHVSCLWADEKHFNVYNSTKEINKVYRITHDFQKISSAKAVKKYYGKVIQIDKSFYSLLNNEKELYNITNNKTKKLSVNVEVEDFTKQDDNNLLIIGYIDSKDKEVQIYRYNVLNDELNIVKAVKGYSIVKNFQSNGNYITCFVGNISGLFVKYDLLYSKDKGNTWNILKLSEPYKVSPSCLVDGVLLTDAGFDSMQKINLNLK
jgi:hypothetical protein